jgi:hypothetical protein
MVAESCWDIENAIFTAEGAEIAEKCDLATKINQMNTDK